MQHGWRQPRRAAAGAASRTPLTAQAALAARAATLPALAAGPADAARAAGRLRLLSWCAPVQRRREWHRERYVLPAVGGTGRLRRAALHHAHRLP